MKKTHCKRGHPRTPDNVYKSGRCKSCKARVRDQRKFNLKHNYGLSLEAYEKMLTNQNGLCAICKRPETATVNGKIYHLAVDHNHETGKNRGLLCAACNIGIGKLKDDILIMESAIQYLQKWRIS